MGERRLLFLMTAEQAEAFARLVEAAGRGDGGARAGGEAGHDTGHQGHGGDRSRVRGHGVQAGFSVCSQR